MIKSEIREILQNILDLETEKLNLPSDDEWKEVTLKFNCSFDESFVYFIELMSEYVFPGDVYNVSKTNTNGNDHIVDVYNYEMQNGSWDSDYIPFYGIGNGDYFCLNKKLCPKSPVFYFYHDEDRYEKNNELFEDWIKDLPAFLS